MMDEGETRLNQCILCEESYPYGPTVADMRKYIDSIMKNIRYGGKIYFVHEFFKTYPRTGEYIYVFPQDTWNFKKNIKFTRYEREYVATEYNILKTRKELYDALKSVSAFNYGIWDMHTLIVVVAPTVPRPTKTRSVKRPATKPRRGVSKCRAKQKKN